jgi:hypothetical protein
MNRFIKWLVTPSGGPYADAGTFKRFIMDAPLPAHILGGIGAMLAAFVLPPVVMAVLVCGVWQWSKADTLGPRYPFRTEVLPRMVLGVIGIGLVLLGDALI